MCNIVNRSSYVGYTIKKNEGKFMKQFASGNSGGNGRKSLPGAIWNGRQECTLGIREHWISYIQTKIILNITYEEIRALSNKETVGN